MPYLNVVEVESALSVAASAPYTAFTQLYTLPNLTWEGRQCHAIKIANGGGASRPGVYFLGGVHAREWGSADILINFVEQLEQAYHNGTSLTFGSITFSVSDIQTIVNTLDIIVFPQANPDGRSHSMNTEPMWRKNRRTAAPNSAACAGVDINRNYDFLWNFPVYFSPASAIVDSTDPCDYQLYHGPSAFSEPETRNAKWIFDNFSNIGFFVDLHSYSEDILYSWGDDQDQTIDPSMDFLNPAFDGTRGVRNDAYKEYIPANDLSVALALANTFHDGIQAPRGKNYTIKSAYDLYPTAGTSDDYAYARHFVDPGKQNVISYTLEWGQEFQPPYSEMQNIIQDITCGLLAFCLHVRKSITDCVVITDRSTFGKDEIDAMLHLGTPTAINAAFYVIVDGFPANELGITGATFTGTPNVAPTITFNPPLNGMTVQATACSAPDETNPDVPQRFTWTYDAIFSNDSDFTGENVPVTVSASITSTGNIPVTGEAVITLTTQPNPYEVDGPTSWLSVDLQVFNILEGGHLPGTPGIALNAGPIEFIHRLLANTGGGYNDPGLARAPNHPFDLDLVANENTSAVNIAGSAGGFPPFFPGTPVYNFAVARVRYRALSTPAASVRVFFRMFQASTTSTDFQPATTYSSGGLGGTKVPLLGVANGEVVTIPFFAAPRVNPSNPNGLNSQTDPDNVGPVGEMIPPDGSGSEVQVYFGCWLDINQTTMVLPDPNNPASAAGPYTAVQSIQQAIRGKHQCLVAEINLDPPEPQIATGATPATSDKLAQRNLTIVGVASPHQVPQTFDIKPTRVPLPPGKAADELMIDWGRLPAGSKASIYLPGTSGKTILEMADRMYTRHGLSISDAHTLTCVARGITYMPIPPGMGSNYAGLLTVDLPSALKRTQGFKVIARQVTSVLAKRPTPPPPRPSIQAHANPGAVVPGAEVRDLIEWRRVLGSFQLSVPVETREVLLGPEGRLLSVLRWIAKGIPHHNRWYPVFHRYLEQTAGRVSALGGDPNKILPSPSGDGDAQPAPHKLPEDQLSLTGKVAGLIFDRFGDFAGFLLDTEDGDREFLSREKEMEELAGRAWRERLRLTVWAERDEPHRPLSIIVRQPPAPFGH
jgi:murein tripeptide amidase MpaA